MLSVIFKFIKNSLVTYSVVPACCRGLDTMWRSILSDCCCLQMLFSSAWSITFQPRLRRGLLTIIGYTLCRNTQGPCHACCSLQTLSFQLPHPAACIQQHLPARPTTVGLSAPSTVHKANYLSPTVEFKIAAVAKTEALFEQFWVPSPWRFPHLLHTPPPYGKTQVLPVISPNCSTNFRPNQIWH